MMLDTPLGSYLESGVQNFVRSLPRMVSFENHPIAMERCEK